ncbi:MAG: hypothetical protein A2298_04925 [Gammaproteobacteria bacterium RIFOXYB2_FULL_38_6]|nr:MAG: hypothetical protein A2298_04925 [Gammaproteobacteria bacterium RIFOXYB2_FULL_38_6]
MRGLGLNYFGKRFYDSEIGRWVGCDPMGQFFSSYAYAGNGFNTINAFDPDGADMWVEGASKGEPKGHLSVCVGNPYGDYKSYSFGVNGNVNSEHFLEGEVYIDQTGGGQIQQYVRTTAQQDKLVSFLLDRKVGNTDSYSPWNTCRTFSLNTFVFMKSLFGADNYSQIPQRETSENPSDVPSVPFSTIPSTDPE